MNQVNVEFSFVSQFILNDHKSIPGSNILTISEFEYKQNDIFFE